MKVLTIIKKEVKEIVVKKAFIIGTLLTPLLMVAMVFLPSLIMGKVAKTNAKIMVIDFSNNVFNHLKTELEGKKNDDNIKQNTENDIIDKTKNQREGIEGIITFKLEHISTTKDKLPELESKLKKEIGSKKIYGYLIIPDNFFKERKVIFKAKNVANIAVIKSINSALRKIATRKLLEKENFPENKIEELTKSIKISTIKIEKGKEKKSSFIGEYLLAVILVVLIFMVILVYGQTVMRSIVEEKNVRVTEVLLSSVDSFTLFLGKITGIGTAGLLQVVIWAIMFFGGYIYFISFLPMEFKGASVSPMAYISFAIFFILGYFLYSTLFAIAGAVSNTDQEAQQFLQPIMILLILPYLISFSSIQNPDNAIVVALSFFPFFTPMLMFVRVAFASVPVYQFVLSVMLMTLTIIGMIFIAAKIFRIGILSYGKKPNLRQILLWIKER
jgi:ABC-2 type transport system permease protein